MDRKEALNIYIENQKNPADLYRQANQLRQGYFANKVELCSIINAKSGNCSQDCRFCAQSARYNANVAKYPLVSVGKMVECAMDAAVLGANSFGIVTSGDSVDKKNELPKICEAVSRIRKMRRVNPDASLGSLTLDMARQLKDAGLVRYHHNIETSERFFPRICTTHSFKDRIDTVVIAKKAGLEVCCGGIFGLGEAIEDRVDFAFTLKELDIDSVPLNFLMPIAGTPLENAGSIRPDEILMTIALFRLILPQRHIKVCAGREANLKGRQNEIFCAGANGMMVGGYLTQGGNPPKEDLKMLEDLGLAPAKRSFVPLASRRSPLGEAEGSRGLVRSGCGRSKHQGG